jgi:uncharacterized protein (DUF1501 family)
MPSLFAQAAQSAAQAGKNDHILVVIELEGGNDGLNTLIPVANDIYYKKRPTLGVPKDQVIKLSDQVGLHPAMVETGELFKSGKLAVVQGVGYPEPDRSHFRSREIWHTASTAKKPPETGWLGRLLDSTTKPGDEGLLGGLAFTEYLPQAFMAKNGTIPVIGQLEKLAEPAEAVPQIKLLRHLSTGPVEKTEPVGFLRRQAAASYRAAEVLRNTATKFKSQGEYPGDIGIQLRRAAQVITAGLDVRLLFASQSGYDNHNRQADAHAACLKDLAAALAAFEQDLEKYRMADRVVVMVFSEFGRRVEENASQGTDHGAASCMFLAGAKVKGGLAGAYPGLDKLDDGDLVHTVDFRSVYATVLEKWLGCSAEPLLGNKFPLLDLIRA